MYEKTLILVKPDGVQRRLVGRLLERFEACGLKLHALRLVQAPRSLGEAHYAEHAAKPFFPGVVGYLCSGPVVAIVLGGNGAIARVRIMVGKTTPADAAPGTIRGDFCHAPMHPSKPLCNLIHASANQDDATREIALWFQPAEVLDYPLPDDALHGM